MYFLSLCWIVCSTAGARTGPCSGPKIAAGTGTINSFSNSAAGYSVDAGRRQVAVGFTVSIRPVP